MDFQMDEPLSLANVCSGQLELDFQELYRKVVNEMNSGDKASISITIDMERVKDTASMFNVGYKMSPKYPVKGKSSMARMGADRTLCTEKVAQRRPKVVGLFPETEDK